MIGYQARSGRRDDWVHTVTIKAPEAGGAPEHVITPTAGFVQIHYIDNNGDERYWDGANFVVGAPITLNTTITGTQSKYEWTHQPETRGRVVYFEGWITRAGFETPHEYAQVNVLDASQEAKLSFKKTA